LAHRGGSRRAALVVLIVASSITLGLETSRAVAEAVEPWLLSADRVLLSVCVAEILLRLLVYRTRLHHEGGTPSTSW